MGRLHFYRRTTQILFALVVLLMPVFDILRYDVSTRTLYLFTVQWSLGIRQQLLQTGTTLTATDVTVAILLKAVLPWLLALAFFPLMGVLFGRGFCGWLCPEGAMFELVDYLSLKILGRRSLYRKKDNDPPVTPGRRLVYVPLAVLVIIGIPVVSGVFLAGYFISPERIFKEISTLDLSFGLKASVVGVTIYMLITSLFVRHTFCKYICAAGLMQMLFGWISPVSLRVVFKKEEFSRCTDCRGCEKVCFMDVKPRSTRRDINCVNCGECITACRKELGEDRALFRFKSMR